MQLPSGIAANIDVTNIFNALQGGSLNSVAATIFSPAYYIRFSGKSDIALEVNGVAELKNSGAAVVTTSPIEGGTYQSINKVKQPTQVVCTVILNGFGLANFDFRLADRAFNWITDSSRAAPTETLKRIKDMITTTSLYDIETPKETFIGYDLINYAYSVSNSTGVSMLTIQLTFAEIIQKMQVTLADGTAVRAGKTPLDNITAAKGVSACERGGIASRAGNAIASAVDSATAALKPYADAATEARDSAIAFIKNNIL